MHSETVTWGAQQSKGVHEDTLLSAWHHLSKHKLLAEPSQIIEIFCREQDAGFHLKEGPSSSSWALDSHL